MGLPEIFINFQTAAVSAITRSARGVLAVALTDATEGGAVEAVYKSLAEVPQEQFTADNYRLLQLAFLSGPSKVAVIRDGEGAQDAVSRLKFDWLAAPAWEAAVTVRYGPFRTHMRYTRLSSPARERRRSSSAWVVTGQV